MRICLGGDVMLGRGVDEWVVAAGRSPFAELSAYWHGMDLVAVNLECALTDRDTWYQGPRKAFYFRGRPEAARLLAEAGVDVVTLANNHALDAGEPGLADTLDLLDHRGIAHAGAGPDLAHASRPAVVGAGGLRVAFLSYCDHQEDFAAGSNRPGIRYLDLAIPERALPVLAADVRAARAEADLVIVAFHWQANWAPVVEPPFRRVGRHCLRAGASVVWGHSPHHFQGVEWAPGGVILYSTGDLVDDYAVDPVYRNDRQLLFTLELDKTGVTRVAARPIELRWDQTRFAGPEAAEWIRATFGRYCAALGTRVTPQGDHLLVPAPAAGAAR